ncbi:hypothetical protein TRIUR3_22445 [Triticum urartu]|uniref:Uncharacterized protein n=1 Tax=Triticum urartu TaxID=4572 RepID=M8AMF4_TRIUA|nr:hypothetical protein TRIUR3_22445 [Triticum urartu]
MSLNHVYIVLEPVGSARLMFDDNRYYEFMCFDVPKLDQEYERRHRVERVQIAEVPCVRYLIGWIAKTFDYINRVIQRFRFRSMRAGDVAFEVPMSLVVTLERVLGDESVAELLTTNKLSELACLALYLMYEKKQGRDSLWYPYIKELDRQRGRGQLAVESPLLWIESELDYLNGSPMRDEVVVRDEGIRREYNELDTLWFMAGSLFKVICQAFICGSPTWRLRHLIYFHLFEVGA